MPSDDRGGRARDDDDRDDRPRRPAKKKGMSIGMILLIIFGSLAAVGCVVCTGVGVVGYFGFIKAKEAIEDMAPVKPGKGKIILTQQGRLTNNDQQKDFKPHRPFQVRLEQGVTYVIDMQSGEMDSFLKLYDPKGQLVAQDDDGGGFPHARIRYTCNAAGNYTVSATCFGGGVPANGAAFSLTVREAN
jgi:hypothetical protein